MSRTVTNALNAAKKIFKGLAPANVTALQNIYIYPDDYSSVDVTTLPFMVLMEGVGRSASIGDLPAGRNSHGLHLWHMEAVLYLNRGEKKWPSSGAATAELQHRNWAVEVNDLLASNRTLGGNVFDIGERREGKYIYADYLIDHEQWNQEPFWTIRFLIPVIQVYDRGG